MTEDGLDRRRPNAHGSSLGTGGWLALKDDDLLYQIEALAEGAHGRDQALIEVVKSDRHFFIRQEAAKKIRDPGLLRDFAGDRHIGQIMVRQMTRTADILYLQHLRDESRYIEVRKAADAQLQIIGETSRKK